MNKDFLIDFYVKYLNLVDKLLPVGGFVRRLPYVLVFKTTNYCWYNCLHCCENSGPDQAKYYIPAPVIKSYISQALTDPTFSKNVVFTGGEIMSSYRFGDKNYVPELLTFCQKNGVGVNIKTNAAWVNADFGKKIFDDLSEVISNGKPYSLQISVSLDNYHKNSLKNCIGFIKGLHKRDKMHAIVHLSSFDKDKYLYTELCNGLRKEGIKLNQAIFSDGRILDVAGDKLILVASSAVLFNGGRAVQLEEAQKTTFPQFSFLSPNKQVLMAFDSFGCVTLGENSGRKINTKWKHNEEEIYSLAHIKQNLISSAHFEEIRARLFYKWR